MNIKRTLAALLALLLTLTATSALAAGKVTPETPADPDIRATFGAWVEGTLVPYLQKDVQKKWSAKRCHAIADMAEAAGFPIADKWKDALYRTKRDHRLYDEEALSYLIHSQYGEYWEWTVEDKSWYHDICVAIGTRQSKFFYAPTESDGTTSQALAAAHDAICSQYGVTEEQWQAYDINVDFVCGGTEDGGSAYCWMVAVMPDCDKYDVDFAYTYTPATGEVEVEDHRRAK